MTHIKLSLKKRRYIKQTDRNKLYDKAILMNPIIPKIGVQNENIAVPREGHQPGTIQLSFETIIQQMSWMLTTHSLPTFPEVSGQTCRRAHPSD